MIILKEQEQVTAFRNVRANSEVEGYRKCMSGNKACCREKEKEEERASGIACVFCSVPSFTKGLPKFGDALERFAAAAIKNRGGKREGETVDFAAEQKRRDS